MTGKYMLDVFGGPGFLEKASNDLGLRGYVLDTKLGPRYDVTKPLVLTRIREDVSAGKCVAGLISLARLHTSSSQVISASASIANMLHRARMLWILEHPCDSWLWDVPKIDALAAQLRTAWDLRGCVYVWISHAENGLYFWLGTWTAEMCTVLIESALGQADIAVCLGEKTCSSRGFRLALRVWIFT